jgi:DNA-binding NarL/FixJ family response regulator
VIRLILVDDQALVLAGMQRILREKDGFDVVATCSDGAAAIAETARLQPDVVVMDVRMKGMDGVEATARIRDDPGGPPVLILTTFDDDEVLSGALRAGASGFILKDASAEDLMRAVQAVAAGDGWLDPTVTGRVLAAYRAPIVLTHQGGCVDQLTSRETDVLRMIGRGATNSEIAAGLYVSEGTVKTHIGHVFAKLGLRDRAAAIVWAFDHGLVAPGV